MSSSIKDTLLNSFAKMGQNDNLRTDIIKASELLKDNAYVDSELVLFLCRIIKKEQNNLDKISNELIDEMKSFIDSNMLLNKIDNIFFSGNNAELFDVVSKIVTNSDKLPHKKIAEQIILETGYNLHALHTSYQTSNFLEKQY